jgi:hypothetical protein
MSGTPSTSTSTTTSNWLFWSSLVLIFWAAASGLIEPLFALTRFVPRDPNEGWNAFFSQIAMRGGDLYPAPGGTVVNNYPPLSFYVVGIVGRMMGDNIFAGRLVALLSMPVVVANIYFWLRVTGSANRIALIGAATFAAFALTYARPYAGMDDPQWLAHAFMTTGLVVLWRNKERTGSIGVGSLLMLAGGWTKHLLIPIPMVVTWWYLRSKGRMRWIVCFGVLLLAICVLMWARYGSAFFESLHSVREYSFYQAIVQIRRALKCLAPITALALLMVMCARKSERTEFAAVYLMSAALVGAVASSGIGVGINAFFDFMIAASLCAALGIEAFWTWRLPGALRSIEFGAATTLLLGIYLAAYAGSLLPNTLDDLRNLDSLEKETLANTQLIRETARGRAACEKPELCYWSNNDFLLDFFNFGQRLKLGREPLSSCASLFDGKYISVLQLDAKGGSIQLPQSCNTIIQQNYRLIAQSSFGVVLAHARFEHVRSE